jgi:hypothetical protein
MCILTYVVVTPVRMDARHSARAAGLTLTGDVHMRGFAGLLLAAVSAYPQAAPPSLTATKTRDTYAVGPPGGITLRLEERGTFSRNSAGDEATHLKVIRDGQTTSGSSVISLRKEGRSYVIDDAGQQYKVVPWPESLVLTNEAERKSTPAVIRAIDGVKCLAMPARDSAGKIVGKNWVSPDYAITVRSEMDVWSPPNGRYSRTGG